MEVNHTGFTGIYLKNKFAIHEALDSLQGLLWGGKN